MTARLCSLAATKNTSSSASMTVSPSGMIPTPRRKIAATLSVDSRHAGRELAQGVTDEGAPVVSLHADQSNPSVGKIEHLQRTRGLDQPINVLGDELLRTDDEVDGKSVPGEQLPVLDVVRGSHACNLGGRAEDGIGHLARNHVRLVAAGHGEHEIGVLGARRSQHVGMRRMPVDGPDVEVVLKRAQPAGIDVDHGDVVGLAGQRLRHGGTDLSGAENDDLHGGLRSAPGQVPPLDESFGSMPSPRSLRYRWVRSMPAAVATLLTLPPALRNRYSR